MGEDIQAFAVEIADAFECHRNCLLAHAIHQMYLTQIRTAFRAWNGICTECARQKDRLRCSRLLQRLIRQAGQQCVLVYAFCRWDAYRTRMHYANRVSSTHAEVRYLESLCVNLKVQRASEAFHAMGVGARISLPNLDRVR